jgi:hypothetical protein
MTFVDEGTTCLFLLLLYVGLVNEMSINSSKRKEKKTNDSNRKANKIAHSGSTR